MDGIGRKRVCPIFKFALLISKATPELIGKLLKRYIEMIPGPKRNVFDGIQLFILEDPSTLIPSINDI